MYFTRIKALFQLGIEQTSLFAWYRWGLQSGYLRWRTQPPKNPARAEIEGFLELPDREQIRKALGEDSWLRLFAEAEEIISGKVRLFGGEPVELILEPPKPLSHWTDYRETEFDPDIKFIWEPARFGWAITLARAYYLSNDERFADSFWKYTDQFITANPVFMGPHWMSAQEAAIRLTSLFFAYQIFRLSPCSTPERVSLLSESLAQHAARIPPTLAYARAQNNNHLLTEAMGLITASFALPSHREAPKWLSLGWKWFLRGLQAQITEDGEYIQHSTNYNRLMLQTALWVNRLVHVDGKPFPQDKFIRLAQATRWLASLTDPHDGCTPNLGPNDGANIFPLSSQPFRDFRPTLQAAGRVFLGTRLFPDSAWDEMSHWLCPRSSSQQSSQSIPSHPIPAITTPLILRSTSLDSWAYLRCARFNSRPGHADQLHLDLWWRGMNIAQDPGTYLYNAPPPWDNALTSTFVHNTITIDEKEQMTRAGRFLYLDWAQGEVLSTEFVDRDHVQRLTAQHNGYRHLGITHQRTVGMLPDGWAIEDQLIPRKENPARGKIAARLHWLLPDWAWKLDLAENGINLQLLSPFGWIALKITGNSPAPEPTVMQDLPVVLVRAGRMIYPKEANDEKAHPTWGWTSPTYGIKHPALSFSVTISGILPLTLITNWNLKQTT